MVTESSAAENNLVEDIKQAPQDADVRALVRATTDEVAAGLDRATAPSREELAVLGAEVLARAGLAHKHLGFAMVAVSNSFWREQFEAVPTNRRLLLLPKCMRDPVRCIGTFDSVGLNCMRCGACEIAGLSERAEALGYEIVVSEGTSAVIMKVLEGSADAILGVSCLDSLDKSFQSVADLGVPNQAIPLLYDGCIETETDLDLVIELMEATGGPASGETRSPLPLLRETVAIFDPPRLRALLGEEIAADVSTDDPLAATDAIALDWLGEGGKRLRPFVTVAAYAVGKHGAAALAPTADATALVPDAVLRVSLAIEALHKASLVHDDIEDGDEFRYGRPTVHQTWGLGAAVNVGDHLVGLGYRLVAAQADELGGKCVADILARLSAAHLELCRGQGAELVWQQQARTLRPVDALTMAALKTAPAFQVALYAGLRAAEVEINEPLMRRFATYVGEAYQALNDLDDWRADAENKVSLGRDVLAGRPTILRAFATEAGAALTVVDDDPDEMIACVRELYRETGALDKTRTLVDRLREKALEQADAARPEALGELMRFLVRTVLRTKDYDGG